MEDFQNQYILVFDLTLLQHAPKQLHCSEVTAEISRLEVFCQFPLVQVTKVLVLGERLSNIQIDKFGKVAKNFSHKKVPIKTILGSKEIL